MKKIKDLVTDIVQRILGKQKCILSEDFIDLYTINL